MKNGFRSLSHLGLMLLALTASAQDDAMSTTAGTTALDSSGQAWAYLIWQATDPTLLADSRFAVYAKAGGAASASPYTKLGETALEASPSVLQGKLDRAVHLGQDLVQLDDNLGQLFEDLVASDASLTTADKLSLVLMGAQADSDFFEQMLFMGRAHVAVNLSLGLGWAEPISGLTTYEIRELDPLTRRDGRVLGRITLDPALGPVVLPAPGQLYQVQEASGKSHLNVRLRWATPDPLQRLDPLRHGFDVYRMDAAFAISNGYDAAPPSPAAMAGLLLGSPADVVKVNGAPALSTTDYSNATVANSSDDTSFIVDDNGRFFGGQPFAPCSQYYYYCAARDLLGRAGSISPGLAVTVCDRIPPGQPKGVSVVNDYQYDSGSHTGDQRLEVVWSQNDEMDEDRRAAAYYVYRWSSATEYFSHEHDPGDHLIAGPIAHIPGAAENRYRDDGAGAPTMPADANKTYWYTVRAVDDSDCDTCLANFSGNSAPTFGVLRDRVGPAGPGGQVQIACADVKVVYNGAKATPYRDLGLPESDLKWGEIPDLRGLIEVEDDCPDHSVVVTQSPEPFTQVTPGPYTITLTATDGSGNSSQCTSQVTVAPASDQERVYLLRATREGEAFTWAEFSLNDPDDPDQLLARVQFAAGAAYAEYFYRLPADVVPNFRVYCRMGASTGAITGFASVLVTTVPAANQALVLTFDGHLSYQQVPAEDCGGPHVAVDPVDQTIHPIQGTIVTTATTRQWKLYRRVDEGELTLVAVGEATHPATVAWRDDSMPINATRVCYFAQLFDEHGNASPMVRLGCTRTTGSGGLPTPMLTELAAVGDEDQPQMKIRWFAEANSVERFQVWISSGTGALAEPFSERLSADTAPTPNLAIAALPGGDEELDFRVFNSSRVGGPDFSATPLYEVTVPVLLGDSYTVMIRAMDATHGVGPASNARRFRWSPTAVAASPLGPDVPWPARSEPPVTKSGFPRVIARQLLLANGFNGLGVRVGELEIRGRQCLGGNREQPFFTPGRLEPADHLYTSTFNGDSIMSFALFRRQVPNANFPTVGDDIVQVSPLLEQIAFRWGVSPQFGSYGALVEDPFFAITPVADPFQSGSCFQALPDLRGRFSYSDCSGNVTVQQIPAPGTYLWVGTHTVTLIATDPLGNSTTTETLFTVSPPDDPGPVPYEIYALDTQGVIAGARYRYLLVRFGRNHEPVQVIPVDEIEVESAQ